MFGLGIKLGSQNADETQAFLITIKPFRYFSYFQ